MIMREITSSEEGGGSFYKGFRKMTTGLRWEIHGGIYHNMHEYMRAIPRALRRWTRDLPAAPLLGGSAVLEQSVQAVLDRLDLLSKNLDRLGDKILRWVLPGGLDVVCPVNIQ
jgi:hypothetical protein